MRHFELIDKQTGEVTFCGVNATRRRPCPICGKPDWCLRDEARGLTICPRTISKREVGEAGYLHHDCGINDSRLVRAWESQPRRIEPKNFEGEALRYVDTIGEIRNPDAASMFSLAERLQVSEAALSMLETGWSTNGGYWTWPMKDHNLNYIGIRTRTFDGDKFSITGSRNGLFVPIELDGRGPLLIEEGPTSTGALIDLGFDAIGRPSCNAAVEMTVRYIQKHHRRREIVIVTNFDTPKRRPDGSVFYPGQEGADKLANEIGKTNAVAVIEPLVGKDSRDWVIKGATKEIVKAVIDNEQMVRRLTGGAA